MTSPATFTPPRATLISYRTSGPLVTIAPPAETVTHCPTCHYPGNYPAATHCPVCQAGTKINSWLGDHPGIHSSAAIADGTKIDLVIVRIALVRRVSMGWIASAPAGYRALEQYDLNPVPTRQQEAAPTPAPDPVVVSRARLRRLMDSTKAQRAAVQKVNDLTAENANQAAVIRRLTSQVASAHRDNAARFAETVKILTASADQFSILEQQIGELFARGFRVETMTSSPDGIAVLLTNPAVISRAAIRR